MSRAKKRDPKLFPEWLQMLQPKTSDGEESKGELSMTGRGKFGPCVVSTVNPHAHTHTHILLFPDYQSHHLPHIIDSQEPHDRAS